MLARKRDHPRIILVEGPDDRHVVSHIIRRSIPEINLDHEDIQIYDKEGYTGVRDSIDLEVDVSGREVLGILVDANANPTGRWQSVTSMLKKSNAELPGLPISPEAGGTIISTKPKVGIWLMPDNISAGALEDFVAAMIPDDDRVWPRAIRYIDEIPVEERPFKDKVQKAKVHAWLATREDPGRFMGQAIRSKDLNVEVEHCQTFTRWLRRLFD